MLGKDSFLFEKLDDIMSQGNRDEVMKVPPGCVIKLNMVGYAKEPNFQICSLSCRMFMEIGGVESLQMQRFIDELCYLSCLSYARNNTFSAGWDNRRFMKTF